MVDQRTRIVEPVDAVGCRRGVGGHPATARYGAQPQARYGRAGVPVLELVELTPEDVDVGHPRRDTGLAHEDQQVVAGLAVVRELAACRVEAGKQARAGYGMGAGLWVAHLDQVPPQVIGPVALAVPAQHVERHAVTGDSTVPYSPSTEGGRPSLSRARRARVRDRHSAVSGFSAASGRSAMCSRKYLA